MDLDESSIGSIPTRPMRVKILYTFDSENKVNCLARFPDVLQIPAVAIDEKNQVGVIELRQCIQAIVSASPELIPRLSDEDFTIYAYDYSELDTPLVGQGMLSAALAVANQDQQGKPMIIGRVCQNLVALFSNGVKETLEVKLKLVPVARPIQNVFAKNAMIDRVPSPAVSTGFDSNAWNSSMQQNKDQQAANDYFNFDVIAASGERDRALVDDIFGFGSGSSGSMSGQQTEDGVGVAKTPTDSTFRFNPAFAAESHSAPGSRAGSPMMGHEFSTHNSTLRHQSFSGDPTNFAPDQSRPGSRASVRSEVKSSHHRRDSIQSLQAQSTQQQTEVFFDEDGQSRKRAKVMQADWHGRSSFGSRSSNLRVTAATAASMHMHRPIPKKVGAPGSNLEPPPRVPTPVPHMNTMPSRPQHGGQPAARRSMLRQASVAHSDFMSDIDNFSDTFMSSPEDTSPNNIVAGEGSPQEIPSSPPVFTEFNPLEPISPGLPVVPLPRLADSGYMSEHTFNSSSMVENLENNEPSAVSVQDVDMAKQRRPYRDHSQFVVREEEIGSGHNASSSADKSSSRDINITMERPGDMNQLPQRILLNLPSGKRESGQGPKSAAKRPVRMENAPTLPANEIVNASSNPNNTETHSTFNTHSKKPTDCCAPIQSGAHTLLPAEHTQSRRGSLALPPMQSAPSYDVSDSQSGTMPSQRTSGNSRLTLQRTHTSSNDSDGGSPAPSDTEGRPRGPNRSGSGAQRRRIIEQRLQESIAKGKMPTFCTHCGAIETPTWRRLYVKYFDGKPSPLDYQEGEGETVGIETVDTDDSGEITRFVIRKAMKKTKDLQPGQGFEEHVVCNSCGLWFNNNKNMRPPDKWHRKPGSRRRRKLKDNEAGILTDGVEPHSDMLFTDPVIPESAIEDTTGGGDERRDHEAHAKIPSVNRPRANSMEPTQPRRVNSQEDWNASQLDAALSRAVHSSPARFQGSQTSPIEIEDLTPKPTCRLLFPSPLRRGEVKSLDDNGQTSLNAISPSSRSNLQKPSSSPKLQLDFNHTDVDVFETFTAFDKENVGPAISFEDQDLADLFGETPNSLFKTPRKTPSKNLITPKSSKQLKDLLKTPTPASRKRKPLSPNPNAANNANLDDFMTSPSSSRYFLRSTPSRLERTPGRNGVAAAGISSETSPWSRQLAQLLSDTNGPEVFTSPSRNYDFSDLPTFTATGESLADYEWEGLEGMLSSEFANFDE